MKLLKLLFGIFAGIFGACLLIITIGYAATIDASIGLPYLAMGLLYVGYKLVLKEKE